MKNHCSDVIVLGAGMAGASLAAELSTHRSVTLLEMEDQPGRHSTGRSAAMFFESYGNDTVRALTRASRQFFLDPPEMYTDAPLMRRRDTIIVSDSARINQLNDLMAAPNAATCLQRIDAGAILARVPILRKDWLAAGVLDFSGHDIDVARMHQAYLSVARRSGAQIVLGATDYSLQRLAGSWQIQSRVGNFQAPIMVNATGAWADSVGQMAGARRIGLQPLRRTACTIPAPLEHDTQTWPMVIDVDEDFYFKPDAGQLLLSPANEDATAPCDVAAEELDIAIAVDRFERATTMTVNRILYRWAGLRSFVADRTPVVGYDGLAEGFFWIAAQGGYGIQLAPALSRIGAALLLGEALPADVVAAGVCIESLSPMRNNIGADRALT